MGSADVLVVMKPDQHALLAFESQERKHPVSQNKSEDTDIQTTLKHRSNRRGLLTLGAAAAAAAAASVMLPADQASAASGQFDSANSTPAVLGENSDGGAGVRGTSISGPGVSGEAQGISGAGVFGRNPNGNGVSGSSDTLNGVFGRSESGTGVQGRSVTSSAVSGVSVANSSQLGGAADLSNPANLGTSPGVSGRSGGGPGVFGRSETGAGVSGAAPGNAPGVRAVSGAGVPTVADNGLALQVIGRSSFSSAGLGTIPDKAQTHTVSHPAVLTGSIVLVTLLSDSGASVEYVARQAGSFTIFLSKKVKQDTEFGYMVVN